MDPDAPHRDPSHRATGLREETEIETPPQHKTSTPMGKFVGDLEGMRAELKRRNLTEASKWTITKCIEWLRMINQVDTATGEEKWELEESFKKNLEDHCLWHMLASMMHFIHEHGDPGTLYDDPSIFMSGARPSISPSANPHTPEANTLYEKIIESLFHKGGCKIQRRARREHEKNPDIWCSRGRHKFVVECKRAKSIGQIEKRIGEAKAQLRPFRGRSGRAAVIVVDCTLPVIKANTALVREHQGGGDDAEERIWRQMRTIYVRKVRRRKNAGWNFLVTAGISYFTRKHYPTFSLQMLPRGIARNSAFHQFIESLRKEIS